LTDGQIIDTTSKRDGFYVGRIFLTRRLGTCDGDMQSLLSFQMHHRMARILLCHRAKDVKLAYMTFTEGVKSWREKP
jgi:hypothetical protein